MAHIIGIPFLLSSGIPINNIGLQLDSISVFRYSGVMNWIKLISDLSAAGVTQKDIAAHCACGQSTISEIGRGAIKNPAYSIGKQLIDMHAEKLGTSAPPLKDAA
jgi:hypothetical protein